MSKFHGRELAGPSQRPRCKMRNSRLLPGFTGKDSKNRARKTAHSKVKVPKWVGQTRTKKTQKMY